MFSLSRAFMSSMLVLLGLIYTANGSIIGGTFSSRITLDQPSLVSITYGRDAYIPELSRRGDYFITLPIPVEGKWSRPNCVLIENDTDEDDISEMVVHHLGSGMEKHKGSVRISGSFNLKKPLSSTMFTITCTVQAPKELPVVTKNNAGGEVRFENLESAISGGRLSLSSSTYATFASKALATSSGTLLEAGTTGGTRVTMRETTSVVSTFIMTSPEIIFDTLPGTLPSELVCDVITEKGTTSLPFVLTSTQSIALIIDAPLETSKEMEIHCPALVAAKLKAGTPGILTIVTTDSKSSRANEARAAAPIAMDNSASMSSAIALMVCVAVSSLAVLL